MRNKILVAIVLIVVSAFVANAYAVGQNTNPENGNQVQQQAQTANQGEGIQIQAQNNEQVQGGDAAGANTGTQTQQKSQQQSQQQLQGESGAGDRVQNQEQNQEQQGQINAERHQSAVSTFVQKLLQVADREGGIGGQVRTIAQQQSQSVDATVQAMEKVRTRSKVRAFFFGSDYKNLGTMRSEMVQTKNRLEQLNSLMENVQNKGDKTELQNQVQILEQEQAKIENFIETNESKFSLFGWLVKLFNK